MYKIGSARLFKDYNANIRLILNQTEYPVRSLIIYNILNF